MTPLTVDKAAARVYRDPETIRAWIRSGALPAVRYRGRLYVREDQLVDAELRARRAQRVTRFASVQVSTVHGMVASSSVIHTQ